MGLEVKSICCQNQGYNSNDIDYSGNVDGGGNGENPKEKKQGKKQSYTDELLIGLNRVIKLYEEGFYFDMWTYGGTLNKTAGHYFRAQVKHKKSESTGYEVVGKIEVQIFCNKNRYKPFFKDPDDTPHTDKNGKFYKKYIEIVSGNTLLEKKYDSAITKFEKCINEGNSTHTTGTNSYLFGALYQHFKGRKYEKLSGSELYKISGQKVPYDKQKICQHLYDKGEYLAYLSETVYRQYIPSSSHGAEFVNRDVIKNPNKTRLILRCSDETCITWTCKNISGGFGDCHLLIDGDSV